MPEVTAEDGVVVDRRSVDILLLNLEARMWEYFQEERRRNIASLDFKERIFKAAIQNLEKRTKNVEDWLQVPVLTPPQNPWQNKAKVKQMQPPKPLRKQPCHKPEAKRIEEKKAKHDHKVTLKPRRKLRNINTLDIEWIKQMPCQR